MIASPSKKNITFKAGQASKKAMSGTSQALATANAKASGTDRNNQRQCCESSLEERMD